VIVIHPERPLAKNVLCFTTTRYNGASSGQFGSLNLASHVGDNQQKVEHNRAQLLSFLEKSDFALNSSSSIIKASAYTSNMHPLHYLPQNHSIEVVHYNLGGDFPPQCDAIYATEARTPLAVLTADCLPIMITHIEGFEVAAIHAGYAGLTDGIIEKTINKMNVINSDLSVWIGPGICEKHFEISDDILYRFAPFNQHVRFNEKTDKFHVNLKAIATDILQSLGVKQIQVSKQCSYCSDDLFSYRQATHKGLNECGRMASVIMHL
jgi:YfiH family protein